MSEAARATLIVIVTGIFWGLYWIPVRALDGAGAQGAWGTVAIALAGTLFLSPVAWRARRSLARADRLALAALFAGGAGFALYSISFIYGRVAIVTLLFFLTPVWSTLIARLVLGQRATALRIAAIAAGLAGLALMLAAKGDWPIPRALGEWMGLASGILWAIGSTGIRLRNTLAPLPSAFVFVVGAAVMALILAPVLAPLPPVGLRAALIAGGQVCCGGGSLSPR
ncbi:DMT family transporter [Sulfitobacter albidus]|uniref:DMT family transporter n=1 Tax=Sulfitobacter albidus TaxID=2829501 RepID=UPI0020C92402|nr:DMT family transporter [Sulfitobacter albidus]